MSKRTKERQRQEQERRRREEAARQQAAAQQTKTPPQPSLEEIATHVDRLASPQSNGQPAVPPPVVPPELDLARLRECYQRLETLRQQYEQARKDVAEREAALDQQAKAQDARKAELASESGDIDRLRAQVGEERTILEQLSQELSQRDQEIGARERDANEGFAERSRQALERDESERSDLLRELAALRQQIADEQGRLAGLADAERARLQAELAQLEHETRIRLADLEQKAREETEAGKAALIKSQEELEERQRGLDDRQRRLELDGRLLDDKRRDIGETAKALAQAEVESERFHRRCAEERLDRLRADLDERDATLREYEERERQTGGRTVAECQEQIRELQAENERLQAEKSSPLDEQKAAKLQALESAQDDWRREKSRLLQENEQMRAQIERKLVGVIETETLQAQKEAYKVANNSLRQSLTELRDEMDRTLQAAKGQTPFPAFSAMDAAAPLQEKEARAAAIPDLKVFAEFVRQRMAWDPEKRKELYYSARDIRAFLGGLAMSRLHILQGISGTGKTSLPEAFARAIGAGHEIVAVQAGWRDRQDLIGHYNTFERRFTEQGFLKALYKAQCPRYCDLPFLIVLDEMNLSRPEQYFADFLSSMERAASGPTIDLLPAPISPSPRLLQDGHRLPWPHNVWFIGTANQDETTVEFADKTYDRAHVMELPRNREIFELKKDLDLKKPYGLAALQRAFEKARVQHAGDADQACQFLHDNLAEPLDQDFRVGWGNRLEEQARWFVPVVIATGGSLGEAVDHLVATKLLRKVRDRHDIRSGDLKRLGESLTRNWGRLDGQHQPTRSLEILEREEKRLDVMRGGDGA